MGGWPDEDLGRAIGGCWFSPWRQLRLSLPASLGVEMVGVREDLSLTAKLLRVEGAALPVC